MQAFEQNGHGSLRKLDAGQSGDHRAIAVAPPRGALDPESPEEGSRLEHRSTVEVLRKGLDRCRSPVAGTMRDQDPKAAGEYLRLERVHVISPTAVEEDQRRPDAEIAIADGDGAPSASGEASSRTENTA